MKNMYSCSNSWQKALTFLILCKAAVFAAYLRASSIDLCIALGYGLMGMDNCMKFDSFGWVKHINDAECLLGYVQSHSSSASMVVWKLAHAESNPHHLVHEIQKES
jgi:hypothetical protein